MTQTRRQPQQRVLSQRDQVLARRRMALIALGVGVVVTLIAAIITGWFWLLLVNIAVGLALAGYVAMLLSIKQSQQHRPTGRPPRDDEMRVLPPE